MLIISKEKLSDLKLEKYRIYTKEAVRDGIECFSSLDDIDKSEAFCSAVVPINHIKYSNADNKFYYTKEDLSDYADWYKAHVLPAIKKFKKYNYHDNCTSKVGDDVGKKIDSYGCIVDASDLPAFQGVEINENSAVYEYRFYLTLFNKYTIKQIKYDRHDLYDYKLQSSKFDLASKLQNSDFLKSKDFKIINYLRKNNELVPVGIILKEDSAEKYSVEYGTVFIDMNNLIVINWH